MGDGGSGHDHLFFCSLAKNTLPQSSLWRAASQRWQCARARCLARTRPAQPERQGKASTAALEAQGIGCRRPLLASASGGARIRPTCCAGAPRLPGMVRGGSPLHASASYGPGGGRRQPPDSQGLQRRRVPAPQLSPFNIRNRFIFQQQQQKQQGTPHFSLPSSPMVPN